MTMFRVWLHCVDGRVVSLIARPGAGFTVFMHPEMIAHLERQHGELAWIATDRPDNIIWRKP